MKKLLFTGLLATLTLTSCSSIKNAGEAQQNRAQFLKMKGNWEITDISYDKALKIKPFDEGVEVDCFKGSQWSLIPNNYSGSYTLIACKSVTQPIKFEVKDGNIFQFKKLNEGVKAKNSIYGYNLTLVNQLEDSFTLKQTIPFQGAMINVMYQFQRVQK